MRTVKYEIYLNDISPRNTRFAGIQGESRVTQLEFTLMSDIRGALSSSGEDRYYRVDITDGAGGFHSSATAIIPADALRSDNPAPLIYKLSDEITGTGGECRVFLVLTEKSSSDGTEKVLYSFPAIIWFEGSSFGSDSETEVKKQITEAVLQVSNLIKETGLQDVPPVYPVTKPIIYAKGAADSSYSITIPDHFDYIINGKYVKENNSSSTFKLYFPTSSTGAAQYVYYQKKQDNSITVFSDSTPPAVYLDPLRSEPTVFLGYLTYKAGYDWLFCNTVPVYSAADKVGSGSFPPGSAIGGDQLIGSGAIADGAVTANKTNLNSLKVGMNHGTPYSNSAAFGNGCTASGWQSFAQGDNSKATSSNSQAFGQRSEATAEAAHAEGLWTRAYAKAAHTEGESTEVTGSWGHAEGKETKASAEMSHAEGGQSIARGTCSHAEGLETQAVGYVSHSEGYQTKVTGDYGSHAEGHGAQALANECHAEGNSTIARGNFGSHAEGNTTIANGSSSHAEGYGTLADASDSHAEGFMTKASGPSSHAAGRASEASGECSYAQGYSAKAMGYAAHAEGYYTIAEKEYSHAEGNNSKAQGIAAHAEGYNAVALGLYSHAEGSSTTASGSYAHAEGYMGGASAMYSHAEGCFTGANGVCSHASGYYTTAEDYNFVLGKYNKAPTAATSSGTAGDLFVIGNGTSSSVRSNAFRVQADGGVYATKAYTASGADIAEFYEWADGNPAGEDRTGLLVSLDGDKIRPASGEDDYILGAVSATPSLIGDAQSEEWHGRFLKDVFGRILTEQKHFDAVTQTIEHPAEYRSVYHPPVLDEEGGIIKEAWNEEILMKEAWNEEITAVPAYDAPVPVENPDYDPTLVYIPREKRPEYAPIGILGKLVVTDDGTCAVNGFCCPGQNGVATASSRGCRVLKRLDDSHVLILFRGGIEERPASGGPDAGSGE